MMTATECPSAEQLRNFSLGRLPEPQSDELFEHLRDCETCKSELETVSDEEDSLIASLRDPDAFAGLNDEPDCRVAVAKALGALAAVGESPATADPSFLPQKIGEYELVRPLGRGGMGSVYLARHTKLGREVALKVLATHRLADKRMRERFEAEMRAVGRLSHPNIVTAHDARELDETAVLVTEYIDGLDLAQLVARTGPLEIADACEIIRQVALALQYTSDQGFVHRDVKPSNIMLSSAGEVKLLDLGLARFQSPSGEGMELTGTGQAMGTADYVAPEQVSDSRSVDARADIYSLGCTLFKLLTGTAPFADDQHPTAFAKMTAHVSSDPPSLGTRRADAPARLVKIVDAMLSKDPDARPQFPRSVAEKLAAFTSDANLPALAQRAALLEPKHLETKGQRTSSPSATAQPKPFMRRPVPMAAAIGAAFFALVLGLLMGVVIKIKYPDGTEMVITAPDGSEVSMTPTGDEAPEEVDEVEDIASVDVIEATRQSTDVVTKDGPRPKPFLGPLQFAVAVEPQYLPNEKMLELARFSLRQHKEPRIARLRPPLSQVRATTAGTWHPVDEKIELPITETFDGETFGLASRNPYQHVSWGEIRGHIVNAQSQARDGKHVIDLDFGNTLGQQMRELTRENLNRQLAIIVDNRIVAAPTIRSEISNKAQITGLSSEEVQYLMNWITPDEQQIPAPELGSSPSVPIAEAPADGAKVPTPRFSESVAEQKIKNSLKQLGLGFHSFADIYKKFPASANRREGSIHPQRVIRGDREGASDKEIHPFSWRVAMLPFVGEDALFEQYNFHEPWDSEANKQLLEKMPEIYKNPFAPSDQPPGHTNYQGFATGDSALGKEEGVSFAEIGDGAANTLLLIQTKNSVPWTKPQDIEGEPKFFDDHPVQILMADGSVHSRATIDKDELHKLITRDGGETVRQSR